MAIKYVLLLLVVMASVLLICQDPACAKELTESNDSEGMNGEVVEASQHKDKLSGGHGNVNGFVRGYGHLGYGGQYGSGYLPWYGPSYGPRYGGRYGGRYGRPFYNGGYGRLGYGGGQGNGYVGYGGYRGGFYGGRN